MEPSSQASKVVERETIETPQVACEQKQSFETNLEPGRFKSLGRTSLRSSPIPQLFGCKYPHGSELVAALWWNCSKTFQDSSASNGTGVLAAISLDSGV